MTTNNLFQPLFTNQAPVNIPTAKQISLQMRLQEKQEEYENLLILKKTSQELVNYFDALALKIEELNNGCEAVAMVLRNWQTVFRSLVLSEETQSQSQDANNIPTLTLIPTSVNPSEES
ncbi:DASH complex subunit Dad2-domain-containing protein [Gigaspora rosea]|uniref:DASH complex subunit DAD2 n=1 Tax=Gigaspora rosea TaxID=44941 RepID=A0A397V7Z0_9GLOM|nr:DASH complex subunit Dad2-domain-containing protein [Gigaspora rosea]